MRRWILLLPAWLIGCLLASPDAAAVQGVCDRTPKVRDKLVEAAGVSSCEDVTTGHLAAVTLLDLSDSGISALQAHDLRGLVRLERLPLDGNSLTILPPSVFHGLIRLEQLALNSNQLRELPPGLFRGLSSLERLWLYGNRIETLPDGIFSGLSELTYLSLAENSLTVLPADAFTGLSKLEGLSLLRNSLSSLPDGVFRDPSSLNQLWLQENFLTTLPEGVFAELVGLRTLRLHHNLLTGVPEEIFRGLGSLRSLSLDHNLLNTLGSGTFLGLKLLQRLTLDSNSLRELPEDAFGGLSGLVELQLRQNRLRTLPEGIFKGLHRLQILTLDGNSLRGLPEGVFSRLSGLSHLTLNRNSLRDLPAGIFRGLRHLRELTLEDNRLDVLPEGVFDHNLATLGASVQGRPGLSLDASLKAQPAFLFPAGTAAPGTAATATVTLHRPLPVALRLPYGVSGTATAADYADLSPAPGEGLLFPAGETQRQIRLNIPAGDDKLGKTLVLTLGKPRIRLRRSDGRGPDAPYLPAEILVSLSPDRSGHTLTFANPDPGSITGGICDRTPQVRYKLLEATGVSACGQVTPGQLASVTLLDLRRTGIHVLQAQDFNGLSSLTSLNLGENRMTTLPEGVFSGLSSLAWLDLHGNALPTLPEEIFSGLVSLETLWLNGNSLSELPDAVFRDLSRLVDLNLGSNSLTALPEGVFDGLNALQVLKLHENSLMELPGGLILELSDPEELIPIDNPRRAAKLEALWLQRNRLTALSEDDFRGLGNLRALLLEGNLLTAVPDGVFGELNHLEALFLNDNSISSLPEGVFQGLIRLKQLKLDHNRLTILPEDVFSSLSHLESLNLSVNSLAALPLEIFRGLTRLEELRLDGNGLADLPSGLFDDTLSELGIGPENQGLHVDATLKARLGFAPAAQTARPGARVTIPVTLHRALPVSLRVPFLVDGNASTADYADLSPSPEEGLLFAAGEIRKEITLSLLEGAGNEGKTIVLPLGQTSEIELFRSDGTGPKAPFLKAETLLSISPDGANHTLTVPNLDPGSTPSGVCDRTPQVRDKLLEATGVSACGQFTPAQLASVTRLDLRHTEIHALRAHDFNGLSSLRRLSLGANRMTTLPEEIFSGLSSLERLEMPGNALSTLPERVFSKLSSLTWLDLGGNALTALPEGIFSGLGSLETLWLNGNSLIEVPEAVFRDLSRLTDLNLGSNSLTALPKGVFDGLSALQALKLHENSLMELPGELFLKLSDTEPSPPIDTPLQPAGLESLWLQGNRLRVLPRQVFLGLGNLRTLLLDRNSLIAVPEGAFGGLSRLQSLRLNHNSITSLPPGIFQGLSSLEELRLDGNRLEALPPGLLDDALSTLGIGPESQGLHVDATLKAKLGFAPAAQTAAPGTRVTVPVTLHRALPVSLRVPYALGGTASSTDYADPSPSPAEGLLFAAGETRTEIALDLIESAGAGKTIRITLGEFSEIRLGPSDGTGPDAPFLKAETLLSGSPDPETHAITVTSPGGIGLDRSFVPVILSAAGRRGSHFTSEMTLTNRGAAEAPLAFTYTAHRGGGSGTATDLVDAGGQKIVPDAIEYLRGLGVPIPAGGSRIGTLAVEYPADSTVGVSVRTTTPVPQGRAGLAYPAVSMGGGFQEPVYLAGLRQTPQDRSNLALQNMGLEREGPIRLRVTVFPGDGAGSSPTVLEEVTLEPGGFRQFDEVLGSLANGYVSVEKTAGGAPFYAYAVINDQSNSDGSIILPVTAGSLAETTGQTVPVILEMGSFTSELTVTNFSERSRTVSFAFVSDGVEATERTAEFSMRLKAGQQVIIPNLVAEMRRRGVDGIGPAGGLAGALFAWVEGGDMSGIVIGARTASPALLTGGRYGVSYSAVPYGSAFSNVAWVEGLQQNQESRTNLALVNTGEVDDSQNVFSIDIYDGDSGLTVRTITGVTIPARGWRQINSILRDFAEGTTQGYVRIRKISGNNPFLAYGVINDGGSPGERSGDGAFLAARE